MTGIRYRKIWPWLALCLTAGCIEPERDQLWDLDHLTTVNTIGYCRRIAVVDDTAYVAAGQAGVNIWDLQPLLANGTAPELVTRIDSVSALQDFNDLSQVVFDGINRLLFAVESNQRVTLIDLKNMNDPRILGEEMSEKTRDIRLRSESGRVTVYAADNDDGLKWNYFEADTTLFGGDTLVLWINKAGAELPSDGNPTGLDIRGEWLALTVDQLGVELYHLGGLDESPVLAGKMDTQGNARRAYFTDAPSLYVACEGGGAYYLEVSEGPAGGVTFTDVVRFAEDLRVLDIAVSGNVAALACGSTGLALYDVSNPSRPEARGIFDIGYVYSAVFLRDYLLVATREGMQVYRIIED
jgi:hypothetical protein